ncbi:hypothetical protein ACK280_23920 [Mycobacterium sherrisii]|uniref:hypothetical protein n=1 Tax=Mycobacterium sherrisii TaxID=243061 RepID=UPI0039770A26
MAEWTGDVNDGKQLNDEERVIRKAVLRLVTDGGSKADIAQAVVHDLAESLTASSGDERDEGATAETFDEGEHYVVMFTFNGDTKALDPDEARAYARDLLRAADEAERLQA